MIFLLRGARGLLSDLAKPPSGRRFSFVTLVLVPLLVGVALTLWARFTGFDLGAQQLIYTVGDGSWNLGDHPFWKALYQWGTVPATVVVFACIAAFCLSWLRENLRIWRRVFLFVILTGVVGPGLITNVVLKEYWGRPRPREIDSMGGRNPFEPVFVYNSSRLGSSFPCGHATMGFFFMGGFFLFRRHRKGIANGFLFGGIVVGSLMGIARMAQGGHFFTDVIWAGMVCYFTPMGIYYALRLDRGLVSDIQGERGRMPLWMKLGIAGLSLGMLAGVLIASPYGEKREFSLSGDLLDSDLLDIRLVLMKGEVEIVSAEAFAIVGESHGHGVPTSKISRYYKEEEREKASSVVYSERLSGWFSELHSKLNVAIPWTRVRRLKLETGETELWMDLADVAGKPAIQIVDGTGELNVRLNGQAVRLNEKGSAARIEGRELLESGTGSDGFYRFEVDAEFAGLIRFTNALER